MSLSTLKHLLRGGLYRCGVLGLHHRWANRNNLTVAMFHRVLSVNDPCWSTTEEEYSMSDGLFEDCLRFFKRHYSPVTLAQIRAARTDGGRLPARPLLVTFDDGWLDNLSVALPILEKHNVPATIFVASSVLDAADDIWWHDIVVFGWNSGALGTAAFGDFRRAIGLAADHAADGAWRPGVTLLDIIVAAARLDGPSRDAWLRPLTRAHHFAPPRQMLDRSTFERLACHPLIEIGAHGHSHLPMTYLEDATPELTIPRERLKRRTETSSDGDIFSMSFPHGRYNQRLVDQALTAGYELIFTSDAVLNPGKGSAGASLGRIGIPSSQIVHGKGAFAPDRLATWLFTRDIGPKPPVR